MRLVSWNVNGLRACMEKGFKQVFTILNADIFCLQETKLQAGQLSFEPEGYTCLWNYAEKKGYSGTAVFAKQPPVSVTYGIGQEEHDNEGRVITAEFDAYYLVCVYTPNAQEELRRLEYRLSWEDAFFSYIQALDMNKPVILCGDLNVAHAPIDLKNPTQNRRNAGFSDEEREKMTRLLDAGFTDSFRYLYPNKEGAYSWWSYRYGARSRNAGWRIDYFIVSERISHLIEDAQILPEITGSDHCPVLLELAHGDS